MAFTGRHSVGIYQQAFLLWARDVHGPNEAHNRQWNALKPTASLIRESAVRGELNADYTRRQFYNRGSGTPVWSEFHPYLIAAERQVLDHAARDRVNLILRSARYHHEHPGYKLAANTAQRTAIDKIEAIRQLGHREMDRAENEAQFRRYRDGEIEKINAVTVAGAPVFSFYGAADAGKRSSTPISTATYTPTWTHSATAKVKVADLVVANADGVKKGGKVSVERLFDFDLPDGVTLETGVPTGARDSQDVALYYQATHPPVAGTQVRLVARNNNGPTVLTVVLG